MRKFLFLALLSGSMAYAALPPFAQSVREIDAIISDPELYRLLGSAEAIQQILKTEDGYAILTRSYYLRVDVQYFPTQRIGPISFQLSFGKPIELLTQHANR